MKKNSIVSLVILILCLGLLAGNGVWVLMHEDHVEEAVAITNTPGVISASYSGTSDEVKTGFRFKDTDVSIQTVQYNGTPATINQMITQMVDQVYRLNCIGGTLQMGFFSKSKADILKFANIMSAMRGVDWVEVTEDYRYLNGSFYSVYFTTNDNFKYFYALDSGDESRLNDKEKQTLDKLREIVAASKAYASDYEKEKFFHDYLVQNVSYGVPDKGESGQTPYEVLLLGSGFSKGYATTFDILLKMVGIPCNIVQGTATTTLGSGVHTWNQVQLDDQWYNVDVTWDDPIAGTADTVSYLYFNVDNETFNLSHKPVSHNVKQCTATEYVGVVKEYPAMKTQDQILDYMKEKLEQGVTTVSFRYEGEEAPDIQTIANELEQAVSYYKVATAHGTLYRLTIR